jgi:hypothetical protein
MGKIVCATCGREENGFCTLKRSSVAKNKRRRCDSYILDQNKVTDKQVIKTLRLPYVEQQRVKAELKKLRAIEKANKGRNVQQSVDALHPLTGDLSRFTSTAAGNDSG